MRNPRRRQRKDSDGLQQQSRRKRSKLNDESFQAPADALVNGNGSATMNGHAVQSSAENSLVIVDMPVREKKAPLKRAVKEDNSSVLVRTPLSLVCSPATNRDPTDTLRQLQRQKASRLSRLPAPPLEYVASL